MRQLVSSSPPCNTFWHRRNGLRIVLALLSRGASRASRKGERKGKCKGERPGERKGADHMARISEL